MVWFIAWPGAGRTADGVQPVAEAVTELEEVEVTAKATTKLGPLEGLELEKEQIPGNIQSVTRQDIKDSMATSLGDLLNGQLQSININDYQGNPFQMDISYRGFSASPQIGTPQGLSVFLDGVRVNEPFGDIVNWDLIPMNALAGMDMFPGSNPLFGLNTLGGAMSLRTKNGFDDAGSELRFQGGSWDRKKGELSAGWNNGVLGGFIAFTGFDEEGWRDNSPSQVNQGFARLDLRGDNYNLKFSTLVVGNNLLGNGLVPTDLYQHDPQAVFTSPDATENQLQQYSLGGELFLNDEWSVTGQVYRRDSSRKAISGDIYQDFDDMGQGEVSAPAEAIGTDNGLPVCRYPDANHDGLMDYGLDYNGDGIIDPGSENAQHLSGSDDHYLLPVPALNYPCGKVKYNYPTGPRNGAAGDNTDPVSDNPRHSPRGYIPGTPIGVLSKTDVGQQTDGASLQLNWNQRQHKFLLGASVDSSGTAFDSSQRLGMIDAEHRVYAAPGEIDPVFAAGQQDIHNNSFNGTSTTWSGYFSETYSPWDNLHLSASGRFNHTRVANRMKSRTRAGFESLADIVDLNHYRPTVILCDGGNLASCPDAANYSDRNWFRDVYIAQDPYFGLGSYSEKPSSEAFNYLSFNPSVGISYLPFKQDTTGNLKELNLFFNWSRGSRAPSSVELGCGYDGTMVPLNPGDPDSPKAPKSLSTIGGACTLPTTLASDPYLPQIRSNSYEFGLRGKVFEDWDWNAGIFRTDLEDDIYLVGITPNRSFFDTIGETRREGIELGFSGSVGIIDLQANYSYTDATFQSRWFMTSPHNSSAAVRNPNDDYGQQFYDDTGRPIEAMQDMIEVRPGDRMPGIPQHNMNTNLNVHLTEQWTLGLSMVAHTASFVRGNENNQHRQGAYEYYYDHYEGAIVRGQRFKDGGSVAGYATFNLKSRFEVTKGWAFFGMVNNLFDSQYATAGRLGVNPFSPSQRGDIGPSGWNYNSRDWQNRTFIGPGAPRAYWVGVELSF